MACDLCRRHNINRRFALHRRDGQERADTFICLAARCNGRPDACIRTDPRSDNGHRGCLHGCALFRDFHTRAVCDVHRRNYRRGYRFVCRDDRLGAERYQEGAGVFDHFAVGLHVSRVRYRSIRSGNLSRNDARIFQGATLSRFRLGNSRHASRTGHASHGRAEEIHAYHLAYDVCRLAGDLRSANLGWLLFKGRNSLADLEREFVYAGWL